MRYRSNLPQPEINGFKLLSPPRLMFGHDAPSDPDYDSACTFWTHDEAAILYAIANAGRRGDRWVDIGSRFGWTAAHLIVGGADVVLVDPIYQYEAQLDRLHDNLRSFPNGLLTLSRDFDHAAGDLQANGVRFYGAVIDGNHDEPYPQTDAERAMKLGCQVIVFHDFWGKPIRDGVRFLEGLGWKVRVYNTPNGVACCWRDPKFLPPDHVPDPGIEWNRESWAPDFDWSVCI